MKISKTWCAFFGIASAGIGATAYLAGRTAKFCQNELLLGGQTLLNLNVTPPALHVDVMPDHWPWPPFHLSLENMQLLIRDAMPNEGIDLFEERLPGIASDVCGTATWVTGTILTLTGILLAMQISNRYKIRKLEEALAISEQDTDVSNHHYIAIDGDASAEDNQVQAPRR